MDPSADLRAAATLARVLGDATRLGVLKHLGRHGGAGMSELAMALDVTGPRLSNHLAKLRDEGLVTVQRRGRHVIYEIADPALLRVVSGLLSFAAASDGDMSGAPPVVPFREARTCYDHLAGRIGVAVLEALQSRGALKEAHHDGESMALGHRAPEVFRRLGVNIAALAELGQRRRLAIACLDTTERAPHLGGASGALLLSSLLDRGWVTAESDSRVLQLTPVGRRSLARALGVRA